GKSSTICAIEPTAKRRLERIVFGGHGVGRGAVRERPGHPLGGADPVVGDGDGEQGDLHVETPGPLAGRRAHQPTFSASAAPSKCAVSRPPSGSAWAMIPTISASRPAKPSTRLPPPPMKIGGW